LDRKLKQTSILSYWTLRYFIVLFILLLALASAAGWWTNRETMNSRIRTAEMFAQAVDEYIDTSDGVVAVPQDMNARLKKLSLFFRIEPNFCVIVTDKDGKLIYSNEPMTQVDLSMKLNDRLDKSLAPGFKATLAPILYNGTKIGQVTLLSPNDSLFQKPVVKWAISLLLVSLTALGWLMIYLLSRKLASPIRKVASAAREISHGRYDIQLPANVKERELNELVISFKEMAGKLKQLEHSRSFMMAGLTHELKTPVTSAKGLIHAVKEKVVQDEEADEFLDIALQETGRLERMVADLLHYNALAAGIIQISHQRLDAAALLYEVAYQWTLHQDEGIREPELFVPAHSIEVEGDPLRIQQIIVNLLNNSAQAKHPNRRLRIQISLLERNGYAEVVVFDNGTGIPPSEQDFVFERFFRGKSKKHTVRGLGLGLAFSKLLAQAQKGDLVLRESSDIGTSFSLTLPVVQGN
jgi:signal transduction histidine kinase